MKKCMVASVLVALSFTAVCAPSKRPPMTPEQLAKLKIVRQKQTGGFLEVKGKGCLAVLSAQNQFDETAIRSCLEGLTNFVTGVGVEIRPASFSLATAKSEREKLGAGVCVYLVDDATLPMSLIALEEGWGLVNLAPLREGEADEKKFALRFRKEFIRVSSVVFSGARSQYKTSPLQKVCSVADLDKVIGDQYGMDTLMGIGTHLPEIGIVRDQMITYREACNRGIAPQPTNEYQQAIWESFHKVPANPMKIEFDPQKGR